MADLTQKPKDTLNRNETLNTALSLWWLYGLDLGGSEKKPETQYAWLPGTEGQDWIEGTEEGDLIEGGDGDDQLFGNGGNDVISGGRGADLIDGGEGIDTADYSNAAGPVMVDLTAGRGYSGEANGDVLVSIENVQGSAFNDHIWGNNVGNVISGNDGDDQIWGFLGSDHLMGGRGNDLLVGGHHNDILEGGEGDDTLLGEDGNDQLFGGSRSARSQAPDGNDTLLAGKGIDILSGGPGADYLDGGDGNDRALYDLTYTPGFVSITIDLAAGTAMGGEATGDTLVNMEGVILKGGANHQVFGDAGFNWYELSNSSGSELYGLDRGDRFHLSNTGGNLLDGGDGWDNLVFEDMNVDVTVNLANGFSRDNTPYADNTVLGFEAVETQNGNDEIYGHGGENELTSNGGNDKLFGRGGDDDLSAGPGDDELSGGNDDDDLDGGPGNDILNGNDGNDDLFGGADADTFVFITRPIDPDQDTVWDFEIGLDKLNLAQTRIDNFQEFLQFSNQVGLDTIIDTGAGSIRLYEIERSLLDANDFIF